MRLSEPEELVFRQNIIEIETHGLLTIYVKKSTRGRSGAETRPFVCQLSDVVSNDWLHVLLSFWLYSLFKYCANKSAANETFSKS